MTVAIGQMLGDGVEFVDRTIVFSDFHYDLRSPSVSRDQPLPSAD
jgi:hypothetical protein